MYQIYLRSFRDGNGDGLGDLHRARAGPSYLAMLGVDGLWLSPCFPSPRHDPAMRPPTTVPSTRSSATSPSSSAGRRRTQAGTHGHPAIVPNHCSRQHPRFREALAAGPASAARARFHFADGRAERGGMPPTSGAPCSAVPRGPGSRKPTVGQDSGICTLSPRMTRLQLAWPKGRGGVRRGTAALA